MKEIKMWSLAFTYVGCFLGAGFISGQELWQFFGNFGNWGYVGLAGAAVLFTVIGILFVRLTQMTQCADVDRLLVPWNIKWLRGASGVIAALFLFFVVVSMSAGVGAMLNQLFHVPTWLGSLVFMAAVFLVTLLGVSGMVNAFSALIPVLIAATVAFAAGAYATFGTEGIFRLKDVNTNPLMPNWVVASLTFVAYNILGGIGIMAPVGQYVRKKKHIYLGIALSGKQRAAGERHDAVPVGRGGEIFPCADGGGAVFGVGERHGEAVGREDTGALAVEADAVIGIIILHGVPCALILPDIVEHRLHAAGRGGIGVPGKIDRDRRGLSLRQRYGVAAVGKDLHIVGGETVGVGIRLRAHLRGDVLAEIVAVEPFAGIVEPHGEREHLGQVLRGVRHAPAVRLRGVLAEGVPIRGVKRQNVPERERFHGETVRVGGKRVHAQERNKQQRGGCCGKNTIYGRSACGFHGRLPRSSSELVAYFT